MMTEWWTTHTVLRSVLGTALLLCAAYCLIRLFLARRRDVSTATRTADASHVVMDGAMAFVFFPIGDRISGHTWTALFGVMVAGFAIVLARSWRRRADAMTAGYSMLCAAGMMYMYLGMGRPMVMAGTTMSMGLRAPAIGWALLAIIGLDAAVLAVAAIGGGAGARLASHGKSLVASVPHVTMNASMAVMLLVMLAAR